MLAQLFMYGQGKPYYHEIPPYPTSYTAANVAARMVDGLGFRYYWATEGLTETDLSYKPSQEARTTLETLEHILGLTTVLNNAVKKHSTISDLNPPAVRAPRCRGPLGRPVAADLLRRRPYHPDLDRDGAAAVLPLVLAGVQPDDGVAAVLAAPQPGPHHHRAGPSVPGYTSCV